MTMVPLQRSRHETLRWRRPAHCLHAANRNFCNVLLAELGRVLPQHVLAFVQSGDGCHAGVVLGLGADNDYLSPQGQWLGDYVPAEIRAYPFGRLGGKSTPRVLAIDHVCFSDDADDPPLFEAGELSAEVRGIQRFIAQCETQQKLSNHAAALLHERGLLVPWEPDIRIGSPDEDENKLKVTGLMQIDDVKLNNLPAADLEVLNQAGALKLAHAQRFSTGHWPQLVKRRAFRQQPQAPASTHRLGAELSRLLGDDDELQFD